MRRNVETAALGCPRAKLAILHIIRFSKLQSSRAGARRTAEGGCPHIITRLASLSSSEG